MRCARSFLFPKAAKKASMRIRAAVSYRSIFLIIYFLQSFRVYRRTQWGILSLPSGCVFDAYAPFRARDGRVKAKAFLRRSRFRKLRSPHIASPPVLSRRAARHHPLLHPVAPKKFRCKSHRILFLPHEKRQALTTWRQRALF